MTPQDEMRAIFFESAAELLQQLSDDALRLEANPSDADTTRSIRRAMHTLKGDAAVLGFRELSQLAHEFEDVLAPGAGISGSLAKVVLHATDLFETMLSAYRDGSKPPAGEPLRAMISELRNVDSMPLAEPLTAPDIGWNHTAYLAAEDALARRMAVFEIVLRFPPDCAMHEAGFEVVRQTLTICGEMLAWKPDRQAWTGANTIALLLATSLDEEALSAKLLIPGVVANLEVRPWNTPPRPREPEAAVTPLGSRTGGVLRVEAAKVDAVLNLIGELVIAKSMLEQAVHEFGRRHPRDPLRPQLVDALGFQVRTLRALEAAAMGIRMVPVEQLFRRFPRLVRDVAQQCGKQVVLETSGREAELDKALVDALAEPLGHLLRNAVDHGIETPAERRTLGKPEAGTIRLHAYHRGNHMVIEVSDDGRGIDPNEIVRRAIALNAVSADEAAHLDSDDILDLVFRPGLSTAREVTAISGRGVGMDVVKSSVQKLKGSVAVRSTAGIGTTVCLKLPLTLAIVRSMLFRVDTGTYAVPIDAVTEIRRVADSEFVRAGSREVLPLRDELVTAVRLRRMRPTSPRGRAHEFAFVLTVGTRKYALVVDSVVGEQELVIKPVDDVRMESTLVSGASVLGDGTVALVLNLEEAVRRYATAPPLAPRKSGETWSTTA